MASAEKDGKTKTRNIMSVEKSRNVLKAIDNKLKADETEEKKMSIKELTGLANAHAKVSRVLADLDKARIQKAKRETKTNNTVLFNN